MVKKITLLASMIFFGITSVNAQDITDVANISNVEVSELTPEAGDFINQKKKQINRMIAQNGALAAFIGVLKDGYKMYEENLDIIKAIRKLDFDQHDDFFNYRKKVNPTILEYSRYAQAIDLQKKILDASKTAINHFKDNENFTEEEKEFIEDRYILLVEETEKIISLMIDIAVNDKMEMDDSQRLLLIDDVHLQSRNLYHSLLIFNKEMFFISESRAEELLRNEQMVKVHGYQD
jgi:hypothetical protein